MTAPFKLNANLDALHPLGRGDGELPIKVLLPRCICGRKRANMTGPLKSGFVECPVPGCDELIEAETNSGFATVIARHLI